VPIHDETVVKRMIADGILTETEARDDKRVALESGAVLLAWGQGKLK
jgi:hypothetical protein